MKNKSCKKLKKSNLFFFEKKIDNLHYTYLTENRLIDILIKFHMITRGLITNRSNIYIKNFCVIVIIANMKVI